MDKFKNGLKRFVWSTEADKDIPRHARTVWINRFSLVIQAVASILIVFLIEWMSRRSFTEAVDFITSSPLVVFFNAFLIFVCLLFCYIIRHRTAARFLVCAVWLALGAINGIVLSSRVTPFNFTDLHMIGDLLTMKSSKYFTTGQEVLAIVAIIVVIVAMVFLLTKGPKYRGGTSRLFNIVAAVGMFALTPFVMKAAIHAGIMAGYFGNLAQGYKDYGFAYSYACSVFDTGISEDTDYSQETIEAINNNVLVEPTDIDIDRAPNVIFIQLESFVDPDDLTFLSYDADPAPNFHRLMEEGGSGSFTVPIVGAGTANTEFECLTGMGIRFFGVGEYPYKTIMKKTDAESMASVLDGLGYSSHAIHNNSASFYGRNSVFASMGFDTFTSKEMMSEATTMNEYESWLTDDMLTGETIAALDSTEGPDFVYTITVQCHGSYPEYQVIEDPAVNVSGGRTEEENWQWQYFMNEEYQTDAFIGELIAQLEERDEPTIVVMYGDHLPTMGLTDEDMAQGTLYNTTYATWNNFGLNLEDRPLTSYNVGAYIMDKLGIHDGIIFRYQQYTLRENLQGTDEFLTAWRMLQYDMLYGERYAYPEGTTFWQWMEMGVKPVVFSRMEIDENTGDVYIYGENFTPWSKVYVDDTKVSTEFIDANTLRVYCTKFEDRSVVDVRQIGGSSTVLYTSNGITFSAPNNLERLKELAQFTHDQRQAEEEAAAAAAAEAEAAQAAEAERDMR